jgi:hypothetical protein
MFAKESQVRYTSMQRTDGDRFLRSSQKICIKTSQSLSDTMKPSSLSDSGVISFALRLVPAGCFAPPRAPLAAPPRPPRVPAELAFPREAFLRNAASSFSVGLSSSPLSSSFSASFKSSSAVHVNTGICDAHKRYQEECTHQLPTRLLPHLTHRHPPSLLTTIPHHRHHVYRHVRQLLLREVAHRVIVSGATLCCTCTHTTTMQALQMVGFETQQGTHSRVKAALTLESTPLRYSLNSLASGPSG